MQYISARSAVVYLSPSDNTDYFCDYVLKSSVRLFDWNLFHCSLAEAGRNSCIIIYL